MLVKLFTVLIFGVLLVACDKPVKEEIGLGKINENSYTNEYLGISMELPEGWVIAGSQKRQQILDIGDELITKDNLLDKFRTKMSLARTATLFSSSKAELFQNEVSFTPSMIAIGERNIGIFGVGNASAYIKVLKKGLLKSNMPFKFPQKSTRYKQAGMTFEVLAGEIGGEGYLNVNQDYFVTRIRGYMFVIIISYNDDADRKIMLNSLKTLKRDLVN